MKRILERIIMNRLPKTDENERALSDRQFESRKRRSTIYATKVLVGIAAAAMAKDGAENQKSIVR